MDFPIHIDTISMGLPILYFKVSQVEFSKLLRIMLHFIWVFTACQRTRLGDSSIQRVNYNAVYI